MQDSIQAMRKNNDIIDGYITDIDQDLELQTQGTTVTKTSNVAEKTIVGLSTGAATSGYALLGYGIAVLVFGSNPIGWIAAAAIAGSFAVGALLGYMIMDNDSTSNSGSTPNSSPLSEQTDDLKVSGDSIIPNDHEVDGTTTSPEKTKIKPVIDFPYFALPSDETLREIDTLRNQIDIETNGIPRVHEACDYSVNFLMPLYENMVIFLNSLGTNENPEKAISEKITSITQQMAELETSNDPDKKHKMNIFKNVLSELTTLSTRCGEANWNSTLQACQSKFKQSLEQAKQAPSQRDAELTHSRDNIRKWEGRIRQLENQPAKPSTDIADAEVGTPPSTPTSSAHSTTSVEQDLDALWSAPIVVVPSLSSSLSLSTDSVDEEQPDRLKALLGKMSKTFEGSTTFSTGLELPATPSVDDGEYSLSEEEELAIKEKAKSHVGRTDDFYAD